jgi:predicted outer membrane protein
MSNITLSVDDQIVESARAAALATGKSLNQLVREFLERLAGDHQRAEQFKEIEDRIMAANGSLNGWKFNREEIYDRG